MIFVDAHVHIYDCFDVDYLFDSAWKNFQAAVEKQNVVQPVSFVLLLTEGVTEQWFQTVRTGVEKGGQGKKKISTKWSGFYAEETNSFMVFRHDCPEEKMYLVAGRQVVTREKIEVLALYCQSCITSGLSIDETVAAIERSAGISVLPWGVGKWMGQRERIIKRFISSTPEAHLFLGDNGGRPVFWPTPALFHFARTRGLSVLPGTDPLPLPAEASRVGSYGFYLDEKSVHDDSPVIFLKNALLSGKEVFSPFGCLQNSRLFLLNQLRLRFSL